MKENKQNFKKEVKGLWDEYKGVIKVGGVCLLVGTFYGFVKGVNAQGAITGKSMMALIDKIPTLPELDDYPLEEVLKGCSKSDIMELMTLMGCDE